MAKVNKSTINRYDTILEARKFKENGSKSTIKRDVQNNGSALGYLGGRLAIGTAGLFEGFGDFVAGSVYQLAGDREYAKYLHDNDVTGGWQKKLDETYNPSRGMQIAGDIASGVGQALPSLAVGIASGGTSLVAQGVGTVGLGMAYAGRGITSAVQKTGDLGAKENAYGVLSGLSESITDMFLGGTQKAGKALWTATRGTVKAGASKVARNGLVKGIWSSSSSEFMEEFLQEYLDTGLLRLTGVDSEASTSLGDALYSGMIGGITGGLLGGATNTLNASNNVRRGESIRARGLESQLLKTANYIRSDYLGKGADFSKIQSEGLRTLSAAVDAYNQLDAQEKANGMRGAMLLGEIQVGAAAFETEVGIRKRTAEIMASPSEEMAQYASMIAGKVVTVADLSANRDGIAETLALRNFTADVMSESGTDRAVNAIHNKIEQERYAAVREGAAWDGSLSEDGEMVFRAPDGRFVIVTADSTEGHEGNYRVGFSETAEYDPDHIKMNENVSLADLKKGLAGLANGSMVIGETRLEGVKAQENAPAGGESVVGDQVSAEGLNEAQRGGNTGNTRRALTQTEEDNGSGRKALPTKRARGDKSKNEAKRQRKAEQMAAEMREARENEPSGTPVPTDGEARAEIRGRGYTDAEANAARGLVKDFDLLQPQARRAIIEMMRSGKATGASRTFMRHAANLIAYWRRDLWVMCDDKIRDDGFFYVFDDGTRLITVKPKKEGRSISEALMHELGHDVWQRANAETRKALYDLAVDGAKKGEIEEIRKRYRDELDKRGDLEGLSETEMNELLDEEVAVNLLGEVLGKEEFLDRLAGGEVSVIKRFLRTLSVMKKRFTGKDKYLYRKADDLFRAFTRVMAGQIGPKTVNNGSKLRFALNPYSEKQKENWKDSRRIVIYENDEQYRQFIQGAQNSNDNRKIYFGAVSSELAKKIHNETGLDVENYNCSLSAYEIRKIYKDHGDETKEAPRGQRAITEDDFIRMPIVIQSADSITLDAEAYMGKPVIHFVSNANEKMTVTAIVSDKHLDLFIQTAYVTRKKGNLATPIGEQAPINTPKASRGTVSNNSISQNPEMSTDSAKKVSENNGSKRSALPKVDADEMLLAAYERGAGVKSQTGENSEANAAEQKPKRRKKTNLQIRSEERARADRQIARAKQSAENARKNAETYAAVKIARAKQSAENARKNAETYAAVKIAKAEEQAARRVRNAETSAENARKNAEKKLAAERERMEREAENSMNRSSRKTSALNRNIQYLKNAVSHRKHTDGGNDAARVLENSALKGFIRYFANRTAANGVANKATREAVRGLLPWYTAENEVLSGNVLDKLLAKSDKNTTQIFGSYDPEVRARMEALAEGEGNLTAAEIESLGMIVGAIARLYESYGRVHLDGRWQDVEGLAREQYADLLAARKALVSDTDENGKYKGALKRLRTFLTQSYLYSAVTPEAVLRDLEGNTKSGVLSRLYRKVRLGEAESKRVQANILQPVAEFFAEKENRAYRRELSTKKRFEYRGEMLTAAQAVGLWETSKRKHAQERLYDLEKGGFRIAVLDEATGRVVTKKLKATAADIDALAHQFTEQDKAYIKALEEAYRRSTEYKIEADRRILGYTNAIEGHYYPITTDENYFARDVTDIRDKLGYAQVVYNKSFNKNTVEGAQAWLFVEDSLKVLNRHASGIGAYSGLFEPLQNFGRVYGAKFEPTGQSVKEDAADEIFFESVVGKTSLRGYINETLWSKHGGHGTDLDGYLTKLFSDVQGIRGEESGVDRLVAKLQGAAVTASFGLNLKVIATQLASYPMAFKNLDADVLTKALGMQPDMEAMDKHSRITFARSFDGTGAAEGGLERLSEVGRLATKGIDLTDRQVIGRLWVACQLQVEKDGGEAFGSEENMRAAGDLLDNLLLDTQTTSLKADASALGRDKNVVAKMLTMFKTESMKSFSNLYGAFSAYVDHRRYAEAGMDGYSEMLEDDKRRIGKTVTAFLMSNAWVAVVAVAFSRIRKAARGEEEEEKIAVSMIKEMGGNVADLFPVVSEISSYLMDGYDMDYMPIASINDTLSMIAKVGVLTDAEASAAEKNKYLRQSVITLGELVGLPTRNAGRIALTLTSNVSASSAYMLRDRYDTAPTYQSDLDRALASGNERLAATVLSAWFDRQKGGRAGDAVAKELMRLYVLEDGEGKKLLSLPKSIPSSLGAAQAAAFSKIYAEADGKVAALLSSAAYGKLDDAAKAKAIRACYDTEWSRAASSLGLEVTGGAEKLAAAEGADPSILAAAAGFAKAYSGEGRKAAVIQYLSSLGLSEAERAVYMAALGYKV